MTVQLKHYKHLVLYNTDGGRERGRTDGEREEEEAERETEMNGEIYAIAKRLYSQQ